MNTPLGFVARAVSVGDTAARQARPVCHCGPRGRPDYKSTIPSNTEARPRGVAISQHVTPLFTTRLAPPRWQVGYERNAFPLLSAGLGPAMTGRGVGGRTGDIPSRTQNPVDRLHNIIRQKVRLPQPVPLDFRKLMESVPRAKQNGTTAGRPARLQVAHMIANHEGTG